MGRKTSVKCLCTFIFFCYYTFCINALALNIFILGVCVLVPILSSGPSQQQNMLNRILALIVIILVRVLLNQGRSLNIKISIHVINVKKLLLEKDI